MGLNIMNQLLMRRLCSLLLILSLFVEVFLPFGVEQVVASDGGLNILKPEERLPEWAKEPIAEMTKLGVIQGYEDGTFRAERNVTRAEITVMLLRFVQSASVQLQETQPPTFQDVGNEWFAEEVRRAARLGIVQGNEAGQFRPDAAVSRQESAVMLNRVVQKTAAGALSLKDKSMIPDWAQAAVAALVEAEVLQGYEDNTFQGQRSITRAEVAVILHRAKKLASAGGGVELAPLTIKVIQSDGSMLLAADVFIHEKGKRMYKAWGRTNEQGVWVASIPYGEYDVHIVKEGYAGYQSVVYEKGRTDLAVTAQQAAQIEGTVLGPDGKPAVGTFLSFTTNPTFHAVTDVDGTFRANVLPEKTYRLKLVEDASLSRIVAEGGVAAVNYGAIANGSTSILGLSLLDSEQSQMTDCGCRKYDAAQTFTSLGAGQTLKMGSVSIDGARPVTTSGGSGGGSGSRNNNVSRDTTPPTAPTGLSGIAGNSVVSLNWTASSESDLAGYRVYMSADNGATWDAGASTAGSSATSHTVSGLANGVSYRFAVTAVDASGNESAKSNTVDAMPVKPQTQPDTTAPSAPVGLSGTAGDSVVSLSWTANSESDLAGYKVYLSVDNGATWSTGTNVAGGSVTAYSVKGLTNGVPYRFAVTAVDTSGNESAKSNTVDAMPVKPQTQPDTTAPSAPTGLSGMAGDSVVSLGWTANSESDLAGYKVYVSTDNGATWSTGTNVAGSSLTSHTVSGLTNGVSYRFAVTAVDASGNESAKSNGVSATPQAPRAGTPPAAPSGLTGKAGNTLVTLNWLANSEVDIAGYEIYYSADNGTTWINGPKLGTVTEAAITGLSNGTAYSFTMTAFNKVGESSVRSVLITITPKGSNGSPDPVEVATPISTTALPTFHSTVQFLYEGSEPLQTGVAQGAIEPALVSVVRGKMLDAAGQPLAGVSIRILDHNELGATKSRTDGMFDLAVNGGGIQTLQLTKDGYMPVQRKVTVTAGRYETLPDVVLKAYDTKVTVIDLNTAASVQTAQGSSVTDADGTRQPTVIFPEGTSATMKLPDGSVVPLTEIHLRATEYTVGENGPSAMPGDLPDFVGYTHAVELSADEAVQAGATEVRFNQRLFYYVENYLDFPVGEAVPMGYYDREAGRWVASDNGKVIRILSLDGGIASIDLDGNGAADSAEKLTAIGFTDKERQKLAGMYTAGQSLWRVPIEHFTPWDCNWPYGPPPDAEPPIDKDPKEREEKDICEEIGSIIGCQNQSLGQAIPIEGTGMNLNYISTRTPGYKSKSKLTIPVSGDSIPASLRSMSVTVEIGGKSFGKTFGPAPNVTHTLQWDGFDAYARKLSGTHPYKVTVSNYYDLQYYAANSDFQQSFGRLSASGVIIGGVRETTGIPISRVWYGFLESPHNPFEQAGVAGWSLDAHHMLSMEENMMYEGDRGKKTSFYKEFKKVSLQKGLDDDYRPTGVIFPGPGQTLFYIAAGGLINGTYHSIVASQNKDGSIQKSESFPTDNYAMHSSDPSGNVYRYSPTQKKIYVKKSEDSQWTLIAGTGNQAASPIMDGSVALESDLPSIFSIAAAADGILYFTGRNPTTPDNILFQLNADGRIQVMGSGSDGADSGRADKHTIGITYHVIVGSDGYVYIHDETNASYGQLRYASRIRKISPDGVITKVAGKTPDIYTNQVIDHGMEANNTLFLMRKMFIDGEGNLLFTAAKNLWEPEKLYKVNSEGIVEEVNLDHVKAVTQTQTTPSLAAIDYNGRYIFSNSYDMIYFADKSFIHTAEHPEEDGLSVNAFDKATGRILYNTSAFSGAVMRAFSYDDDGRLLSISDRSGNLTRIERDAQGKPTAIVAPGDQRTTLEVDSSGELTSITNPAGETYRMKYEGGLLTDYTDPEQGMSQYDYDASGKLVKATNPEGGVKTLHKSIINNGYSVTFTDPSSRTTTYETILAGGKTIHTLTDPNGSKKVTEKIDEVSEKAVLPDGTKVSKKFGTDPRMGKNTPFVTELIYTSPDGKVTTFKEERSAVADNSNQLVSYTVRHTLNGDVSTIQYDRASHKFTETTAEGTKTETYLDGKDRVIKVAWPGTDLFPIETFYDAVGRMERLQQGEKFINYTYNAHNLIEKETDAFGSVKKYEYDAAGRITSITTPGSKVYGKGYDGLGGLTELTMPSGAKYVQQFNKLGQFEGFSPSGSGLWYAPEHDNSGNLTKTTMQSGRVIDHVLESGDGKRPIGINDSDIKRMFTYVGQSDYAKTIESLMPSDSSRQQKIEYGYTGESINSMILTGKANASFSYEYDNFFNMTNIAMTVGGAVYNTPFQYDNDDNLTKLGAFQFGRGGPLKAVDSMADGKLDIRVAYDRYGKIDSVTYLLKGSQVYKAGYAYDKRGFMTDITVDSTKGRETTHYEYDLDGQLKGMTRIEPGGNAVTEAYTYDANKNRITSQVSGAAQVISRYGEHDILERVGALAYSFDADGFLKQRGTDTFTYGVRGELLEATVTSAGSGFTNPRSVTGVTYQPTVTGATYLNTLTNGTFKYTYDGLSRRVAKEDSAGRKTQYLYGNPDSLQLLTASIDGNGQITVYSYNEMGLLIALERGGKRYYVVTDAVGTPQLLLDENGVAVKELRYDTYGNLQSDSNPAFELLIGYAGGLEDRDTGLIRFGFRDYDPVAGRWTARDPILVESGQTNLYAYVNNNPIMFRDPCGQLCVGASVYAVVGIGGKLCITEEGVSACGDTGFGVGLGLEVSPFEDIAKNELSLEAMAKLTAGIGNLQAGYKLGQDLDTKCRTDGPILRMEAGPYRVDLLKPSKSAVKGKEADLKKKIKDLFKKSGLKAEASIKAKLCSNLRW
jgi:RHS repeat-associated protein